MGNLPITSDDREAWGTETEHDLVSVRDTMDADSFTVWVSEWLVPSFHWVIGKHFKESVSWDPASGISWYSDTHVKVVLGVLGTVISSLFPVVSIVALYFVNAVPARLGIVAAFTAVFSLCLALMTRARRVEVFAATTA
jgi:hypothetical protein